MRQNLFPQLFLFTHFPYDYAEFPLEITKGISLVQRPGKEGLSEEELACCRYALPELNFNATNCPNACIRISPEMKSQTQTFWLFVFALRLVKPLSIGVSGACFEDNGHIHDPSIYRFVSKINCGSSGSTADRYSKEDIQKAAKIYQRLCWILKNKRKFRRVDHAISEFNAVTTGQVSLYSFVLGALFDVLEALFASPADGKYLGRRIKNFLKEIFPRSSNLDIWIEQLYKKKRNNQSHGNPDFWAIDAKRYRPQVTQEKYSEVLKLHEIARIAFLGLLGWNEKQLHDLSSKKHSGIWDFNRFFDENKPSKTYLIGQKPYLTHGYKSKTK